MRAVVLVHGLGGSGASFGAVRFALERGGRRVLSPDLRPADGSRSLLELADQLGAQLDAGLEPGERFHLIGFSMGGLIARLHAQHPRRSRRLVSLSTVATPHRGSLLAYVRGGPGMLELRPGSPLLLELARGEAALAGVPVLALWTPFDLMVLPALSARWPGRPNRALLAPRHGLLLRDARVLGALRRHLAQAEARKTG